MSIYNLDTEKYPSRGFSQSMFDVILAELESQVGHANFDIKRFEWDGDKLIAHVVVGAAPDGNDDTV